MTKLQFKHISAVTSAMKLYQTCLDDNFQSHVHKSVQREMDTLIELRDILLEMHRNPSLPFTTLEPSMADPILDQIENEPDGAF